MLIVLQTYKICLGRYHVNALSQQIVSPELSGLRLTPRFHKKNASPPLVSLKALSPRDMFLASICSTINGTLVSWLKRESHIQACCAIFCPHFSLYFRPHKDWL